MKKVLYTLLTLLLIVNVSMAQNVGINATGAAPNASAGLDVDFANRGLLIPRVALTARNSNAPIGAGIATGLMVYNTATSGTAPNNVSPGFYYWNGTLWVRYVDFTVERWIHPPANYAPGTHIITSVIPGVTSYSSVMVNLAGDWATAPNVTIHHVEAQNGQVRFRLTNNTSFTTYNGMDFVITIIR
jgi:hypothetical protein